MHLLYLYVYIHTKYININKFILLTIFILMIFYIDDIYIDDFYIVDFLYWRVTSGVVHTVPNIDPNDSVNMR